MRERDDGTCVGAHGVTNEVRDGAKCLLRRCVLQRLGPKPRERLYFAGARLGRIRLLARTREQFRGHERGSKEIQQHHPVEWLAHREQLEWRLEVVVDQQDADDRQREAEGASTRDAAAQHDEQHGERDVRLVDFRARVEHHRGDDGEHQAPYDPGGGSPALGHSCGTTKR